MRQNNLAEILETEYSPDTETVGEEETYLMDDAESKRKLAHEKAKASRLETLRAIHSRMQRQKNEPR